MISVREAQKSDIPLLYALYHALQKNDDGYFETALESGITVLIASFDDTPCGFCLLNWAPRYSLYKKLGIAEIQDLNVLPDFRRQGVGRVLMKWCEGLARSKGHEYLGVSVGLTKDYGPAQILYSTLGYIPDGNGVTHNREGVDKGQLCPMDDDLALMMVKRL